MAEETTTDAPVETGAEQTAQPVEAEPAPAVQETTEQPEQEATKAPAEKSEDDELTSWAENKGLTLDSENATKAAKMAWNAEKRMHDSTAKASELEKTLTSSSDEHAEQVAIQTGQDPELLKRVQRVEVRDAVRDFWNTPNEQGAVPDRSLEPKMIELLTQKPHLAGDLESLYAATVVRSGSLDAVKSQASRETLESLAHKQQAAVPTGNATNPSTTPKTKPFKELSISEMEAKLGFHKQ